MRFVRQADAASTLGLEPGFFPKFVLCRETCGGVMSHLALLRRRLPGAKNGGAGGTAGLESSYGKPMIDIEHLLFIVASVAVGRSGERSRTRNGQTTPA